jgi:predicted regulator of Ras-like GTPase activity (Roadblock/LC7/MglB family)
MFSLPLLIREDIAILDAALADFAGACGARLALFIDGGGFIVTQQGDASGLDTTTLGALAANSFAATQAIARLIDDHSVTSLYQEGEKTSLLILSVGEFGFLTVVFASEIGVGSVKFYSQDVVARISRQLTAARSRAPAQGLDMATLNLADTGAVFTRRGAQ